MPIILGLPWLKHNGIICDHADRSCIVKETGYDLLHPPKIQCRKIVSKAMLRKEKSETRLLKKKALADLVTVEAVKTKWAPRRAKADAITEADVVTSIRTRIASLAIIQDMQQCEAKLKRYFDPIFGHCRT